MPTIEDLLREVEDAYRHGYGVGYAEGYSKARDPHSIEKGTFVSVLDHKINELKNKYSNKNNLQGIEELGHS